MTTEYFIALSIVVLLAILTVCLILSSDKTDNEIEKAKVLIANLEFAVGEQEEQIAELKQELAKKESLISILRTEIQEKEKK